MAADRTFTISAELEGMTLSAVLRKVAAPLSWSQAQRMIGARRVEIGGTLCLNDARRLKLGEVITLLDQSQAPLPTAASVRLLHIDPHLIVIDKPAGLVTIRHRQEQDFSEQRKELQPTVQELVERLLPGSQRGGKPRHGQPRTREATPRSTVYPVHRLDRDTSGLMLFALSGKARDALIEMFKRHDIRRTYIAVVHGKLEKPLTLDTHIARDRGDTLRGSSPLGAAAEEAERAITHIRPIEHLGEAYTVVECRLETGRTHQIRIHLAEIHHMLCGEKLYTRPAAGAAEVEDSSGAPRQALHSTTLDFVHPMTGRPMHFDSPLPKDLAMWLERLKSLR